MSTSADELQTRKFFAYFLENIPDFFEAPASRNNFQDQLQDLMNQCFPGALGLQLETLGLEECSATFQFRRETAGVHGLMHGGAIFSDSGSGMICVTGRMWKRLRTYVGRFDRARPQTKAIFARAPDFYGVFAVSHAAQFEDQYIPILRDDPVSDRFRALSVDNNHALWLDHQPGPGRTRDQTLCGKYAVFALDRAQRAIFRGLA